MKNDSEFLGDPEQEVKSHDIGNMHSHMAHMEHRQALSNISANEMMMILSQW